MDGRQSLEHTVTFTVAGIDGYVEGLAPLNPPLKSLARSGFLGQCPRAHRHVSCNLSNFPCPQFSTCFKESQGGN